MGAIAFALASLGLIGGFGLIAAGSKKIKSITFPNDFYENLRYFKHDGSRVIAVKNDIEETIYQGSSKNAEKYFNQVQLGFEEWLKENNHTSKSDGGSVSFD
jgi:hypothetical protein